MGFYGNINNTTKVQFSFDRIFSSRVAMDEAVADGSDGVFAGRFVLVSYDKEVHNFPIYYLKDDKLYSNLTDAMAGENEITLSIDTIVHIPLDHNLNDSSFTGYYKFIADTSALEPIANENTENIYLTNYLLDTQTYGNGRGYDGTVWQKMYAENRSYFAMVAELNSIVPTLAITADAPTKIPKAPHFDVDTSNVYYKLHIQSMPGAWLKPANSGVEWTVGTDIPDETTGMPTTLNRNYPSDATYSYPQVQLDGSISYNPRPAAIYFNKAGFDSINIHYAEDVAPEDAERTQKNIWKVNTEQKYVPEDKITIDLNGKSGQLYGVEGSITQTAQPDTYELAIMLPSIGDTMAHVWDLIYGGRNIVGSLGVRNNDIKWEDAGGPQYRHGLRLTKITDNGIGYEQNEVNTIAGAINTVHDLIGMIIVDAHDNTKYDFTDDRVVQAADSDKIYWKNDTYYRVGIEYDPQYDELDASNNKNPLPHFEQTTLNEPIGNTYFDKYGDNYLLIRDTSDFKKNKKYYQWNDLSQAFTVATVPEIGYEKNKYYYIVGDSYILDKNDVPTPGRQYYQIADTAWQREADGASIIWYKEGRFYKQNTENPGEIILDRSSDWNDDPNNAAHYRLYLIEPNALGTNTDTVYIDVTDRVRKFNTKLGTPTEYYTKDAVNGIYTKVTSDIYANIWADDADNITPEGWSDESQLTPHTTRDIQAISLQLYTLNLGENDKLISLYAPGTYYYVDNPVTTENVQNSLLIDDGNGGQRRVIGDIIKDKNVTKVEGRTYFTKNADADLVEHPFYIENEYYIRDDNDGEIKGDETPTSHRYSLSANAYESITYYEKFDKHVIEDSNDIFPIYYKWNPNIQVPNGVQLCWLKDKQAFEELEGYGRNKNTINGLLLETYKKFGTENTRDIETVNGAINTLQDLTYNFATMEAGKSVVVDDYGRMHTATISNLNNVQNRVGGGDDWINLSINPNIDNPTITIEHLKKDVVDTTAVAATDLSTSTSASVSLQDLTFDAMGHVNANKAHTYNLPYNFGNITVGANTISPDNTFDTLTLAGDNWLQLAADVNNDSITLTHNTPQTAVTITLNEVAANNVAPAFGSTFNIADWTFDSNGHMAGGTKHTVTIPDLGVTDNIANGNVLTGLSYTNGSGTFTTARANLGNIALGSYEAPATGGSGNINTATTLAQAIAALDGRIGTSISNLTYAGESEPAANSFVTEVTQTNGIINVTKSVISLSNIAESTTPQLVSYNNQGIVTGGSALTWDTMKNLEVGRDNNDAIITFDNLVRYLLQLHETALMKTLTSIAVTTLPNTVTYTDGDRLSLTGIGITGTYKQGADTTYEPIEAGYSVSPEGNAELSVNGSSTPVTVPVTVTYQGKTATFNVTVNPKVMTGIEITQEPTKQSYINEETLDLTGLVVTASFNNGSPRQLDTSEYVTDPVEGATLSSGDVTVLVTVPDTEFTDSFVVHVE